MSDTKDNEKIAEEIVSLKPMTELTIDSDDATTIIDFFKTFGLKISPKLQNSVDEFQASLKTTDLGDQISKMNKLKLELAEALTTNASNSLFKKRPWDLALACSKRLTYHKLLDEQLENSFSEETT